MFRRSRLVWGLFPGLFLFVFTNVFGQVPQPPAQPPKPGTLEDISRNIGIRMLPDRKPKDAPAKNLGWLSERHEVGTRGPGTISSGQGDAGGPSYGSYQLTSAVPKGKKSNVEQFVNKYYSKEFEKLEVNSKDFKAKWEQLAKEKRADFQAKQHEFIRQTHYDPVVRTLEADLGLVPDTRSETLRNVIWSTAVQHGPTGGPNVVKNALKPLLEKQSVGDLRDADVIKAIYAERGRKDEDGNLVHFKKNSDEVQALVARRFEQEPRDALAALANEQKTLKDKLLEDARKRQDQLRKDILQDQKKRVEDELRKAREDAKKAFEELKKLEKELNKKP